MAHVVRISLKNKDEMRLTLHLTVGSRNTAIENEAREWAEQLANTDPDHGKYAPWTATNSGFES